MNSQSILGKVLVAAMVLAVATLVFSQVPLTFAQTPATQSGDSGGFVICGNEATNPCQIGHLFAAFVIIINYLITMAGFIAVLAIVYAGFMMVYSQGQENLKEAKGRLTGAVIGLVLVAAAYVLINSIFAGTFSLGVCDGTSVLSSPLEYIQKAQSTTSSCN
jgi:hypothetical protein